MPTLTMDPRDTCALCGCRLRGFRIGTYRINKHSLRGDARGGLTWLECPECGPAHSSRNPMRGVLPTCDTWRLDADSQAVVDAHFQRKGWVA